MKTARKLTGGAVALVTALVVMANAAYAQAADPTGGAAEQLKADSYAWISTHGIPAATGLLFAGIVVSLLFKFVKRGVRAA